jgi:dienelactone hydrolase
MRRIPIIGLGVIPLLLSSAPALAQALGSADRDNPGDKMIQEYLRVEAEKIEAHFLPNVATPEGWAKARPALKEEYFYMLGLWPLPPRTPLEPRITGTLSGDGYVVDLIHYQSRPHLYVTGNLYRPATLEPGKRLPAVFYVCGHSVRGRNGNKTAYQSHGIWFARHGYVCLVIDSLQLGEIGAVHHGTYREQRWWWHSRGYTPAGVECWNGIRGIDYLISRPDVDPERIAVTGISGGGAATWWISAADERVKVAVPVSGMADLLSYIPNRTINGHCDCMFMYNTFGWHWTQIAALIAPRPLLFANSDKDPIFPMDANRRVINHLEDFYAIFGAGDRVDALVSLGGHAYRKDIRQAAFRFINTCLKADPREVADSEVDLVLNDAKPPSHPIPPEKLRVFPADKDIPGDQINTTVDKVFVPLADAKMPERGQFDRWRQDLRAELKRVSFRYFPERIPPARLVEQLTPTVARMGSEPGIEFRLQTPDLPRPAQPVRIVLVVSSPDSPSNPSEWLKPLVQPGDVVYVCDARGIGDTRWTRKNPPNYVERSLALLGRTADTGRVWDVIAAARYLREQSQGKLSLHVVGKGAGGILAAYAALWEPDIAAVTLVEPPSSHMEPAAPQFLNVLRVCDVADVCGMLAPRPLQIVCSKGDAWKKTAEIYAAAGAGDVCTVTIQHEWSEIDSLEIQLPSGRRLTLLKK